MTPNHRYFLLRLIVAPFGQQVLSFKLLQTHAPAQIIAQHPLECWSQGFMHEALFMSPSPGSLI
jgi:hypothetical protein